MAEQETTLPNLWGDALWPGIKNFGSFLGSAGTAPDPDYQANIERQVAQEKHNQMVAANNAEMGREFGVENKWQQQILEQEKAALAAAQAKQAAATAKTQIPYSGATSAPMSGVPLRNAGSELAAPVPFKEPTLKDVGLDVSNMKSAPPTKQEVYNQRLEKLYGPRSTASEQAAQARAYREGNPEPITYNDTYAHDPYLSAKNKIAQQKAGMGSYYNRVNTQNANRVKAASGQMRPNALDSFAGWSPEQVSDYMARNNDVPISPQNPFIPRTHGSADDLNLYERQELQRMGLGHMITQNAPAQRAPAQRAQQPAAPMNIASRPTNLGVGNGTENIPNVAPGQNIQYGRNDPTSQIQQAKGIPAGKENNGLSPSDPDFKGSFAQFPGQKMGARRDLPPNNMRTTTPSPNPAKKKTGFEFDINNF